MSDKLTTAAALARIRAIAAATKTLLDCAAAVQEIEGIAQEALMRASVEAIDAFSNALRILHSIDRDEVSAFDDKRWTQFRDEPVRFFLRADDDTQAYLWGIVCARQPKRLGGL